MQELITLIAAVVQPNIGYYKYNSYILKGIFEAISGEYISEEEFINAMKFVGVESKEIGGHISYKLKVLPSPDIDTKYWGRGNELKYLQL